MNKTSIKDEIDKLETKLKETETLLAKLYNMDWIKTQETNAELMHMEEMVNQEKGNPK